MSRLLILVAAFAMFTLPVSAQTVEEIVGRYLKTIGGADKIQAVQTLRRSGKYIGGGGFEAVFVQENKRGSLVREEFSLQGMTAINAYDGTTGWMLMPFQGNKDPQKMTEEQLKDIRTETTVNMMGQDIETETSIGDYKEVNGLYFPYSMESHQKGKEGMGGRAILIDKIELDPKVDAAMFTMPAVAAKPVEKSEPKKQ